MGPEKLLVRRALPLLLMALTAFLLWLGLIVVGPYMISHPPGPNNPSFWWYLLHQMFPILLFLTCFILLIGAWRLWTRGRIDFTVARRGTR